MRCIACFATVLSFACGRVGFDAVVTAPPADAGALSACTTTPRPCDYYASPSGNGDGRFETTPFQIGDFWQVAAPGTTLCLLDGVYRGDSASIVPPDGYNGLPLGAGGDCATTFGGSPGAPVTIRAHRDGGAVIDGEAVRKPIELKCQRYLDIEGVDARAGTDAVVSMFLSEHINVRRLCASDADLASDSQVVFVYASNHVLLEDVAAWGSGRVVFWDAASRFVTLRRVWGRWEAGTDAGMTVTFLLGAYNVLVENAIGTWNRRITTAPSNPRAIFHVAGPAVFGGIGESTALDTRIVGSLAYAQPSDQLDAPTMMLVDEADVVSLTDVAVLLPSDVAFATRATFTMTGLTDTQPTSLNATNISSFGGAGTNIGADWAVTNLFEAASTQAFNAGESIFAGNRGAQLCYRYCEGALTDQPLWPWPMNQRIIDAMTRDGATPVDMTAMITSTFGAIPAACL